MMYCHAAIAVSDVSQIGEARRHINRLASEAGLDEEHCGRASIVASELATNLVRHAGKGELLLRSFRDQETTGIELLAIDRGPGMANLSQCLEDGYSTGGTAGTGLGAIRRLSTEFDIYSDQPGGTVAFARIRSSPVANAAEHYSWGVVNRPAPYEQLSGDTWRVALRDGEFTVMVADGLGHGPQAAAAAESAATVFEERGFSSLTDFLTIADRRMRGTRGAAVAVANINAAAGTLKYVGVGNIAGSLRSRQQLNGKGLLSHNGTVGAEMRKVQQVDYECPEQSLLIMHSDGLQSRWSLEPYPGLIHRHPAVIAAILYRDFLRGRDDVTVGVVRFSCPSK